MNKIKRTLRVISLIVSLTLLMPTMAMASENSSSKFDNDIVFYDENIGAVIANPIVVENGVMKKLTEEEFKQKWNAVQNEQSPKVQEISPRSTTFYRFEEIDRSVKRSSESYTVSASAPGGSTITARYTKTISSTISGNLNADMTEKVKVSLGASYTESASTDISYALKVPDSYRFGQMMFSPNIRTIIGDVVTLRTLEGQVYPVEMARTSTTVKTPATTDAGFANGFYWIQETSM